MSEDGPQQHKEQVHDDYLADSVALLTKHASKLRSQFHKLTEIMEVKITRILAVQALPVLVLMVQINEGRMTKVIKILEPTRVIEVLDAMSVKGLGKVECPTFLKR